MMSWDDISDNAKHWMRELGCFSPTVNKKDACVKGYAIDAESGEAGKTYYSSHDLSELARACREVSEWLQHRANEGDA